MLDFGKVDLFRGADLVGEGKFACTVNACDDVFLDAGHGKQMGVDVSRGVSFEFVCRGGPKHHFGRGVLVSFHR